MTLNDKTVFLGIFLAILGCETHFKSEMCLNHLRHRKAVYEIFGILRGFQRSKSRFSTFKETCTRGNQRAVPL